MKRFLIAAFASLAIGSFVLGQGQLNIGGNHWQRYWGWPTNAAPPISLPEAYSLALAHVGPATNRFYCVAASSLDMTNFHFRGWSFTFSSTNGQQARVEVSFDKELRADPRSEKILREK